jgi:hypothetical protein
LRSPIPDDGNDLSAQAFRRWNTFATAFSATAALIAMPGIARASTAALWLLMPETKPPGKKAPRGRSSAAPAAATVG